MIIFSAIFLYEFVLFEHLSSVLLKWVGTMADRTGDAILPPAPDLLTTELKKKSPKKRGDFAAAVGHGATDASVPSKLRYPFRGTGTKTSTGKGASSHPIAEDDADPIVPAEKAPLAAAKLKKL